jgi:hypothetical protein
MGELHFKILDQRHNQKVCTLSDKNFGFVVVYVCVWTTLFCYVSAVIGIELTRQAAYG